MRATIGAMDHQESKVKLTSFLDKEISEVAVGAPPAEGSIDLSQIRTSEQAKQSAGDAGNPLDPKGLDRLGFVHEPAELIATTEATVAAYDAAEADGSGVADDRASAADVRATESSAADADSSTQSEEQEAPRQEMNRARGAR